VILQKRGLVMSGLPIVATNPPPLMRARKCYAEAGAKSVIGLTVARAARRPMVTNPV